MSAPKANGQSIVLGKKRREKSGACLQGASHEKRTSIIHKESKQNKAAGFMPLYGSHNQMIRMENDVKEEK